MAGRTAPQPTRRSRLTDDASPVAPATAHHAPAASAPPPPTFGRALFVAVVLCTVLSAAPAVRVGTVKAQSNLDDFVSACANNGDNPWLVTTAYPRGSSGDGEGAIVAFRDTRNNSDHRSLVTAGQIGAAYGLAFDRQRAVLYASAFHKRGTHFGPAGPGGVYAYDVRTGQVGTFATVPNAGADTHNPGANYFPDTSARNGAGKTSLGDLDLSADGRELAVMNLNDRRIYRFAVEGAALLGSFAHGASNQPWAGDARPFGLGWYDGRLYHGVVNSAQTSRRGNDLEARVYSSNADGTDMRQEARTILRFDRGAIWPGDGEAEWQVWRDPPGTVTDNDHGRYPQPILSDIDFTANGDQMVLGFRDRFGDQTFYTTPPNQPPPGERIYNTPAGDILPAFRRNGAWEIQISPEYYDGDYGPQRNTHQETSYGGLAVIPWLNRVAFAGNSPLRISSAGVTWLSTGGGDALAREELYVFGQGDNFGKANGLGDVELLCPMQQVTPTPESTETPTATVTVETATATTTITPTLTATTTATTVVSATSTVTNTATAVLTETPTTIPSPTVVMTVTVPVSDTTPVVVTVTPPPDAPRPPDTPAPPDDEEERKDTPQEQPQPTPVEVGPTPLPGWPSTGGGGTSHLRMKGRLGGDASWVWVMMCVGVAVAGRRRWGRVPRVPRVRVVIVRG